MPVATPRATSDEPPATSDGDQGRRHPVREVFARTKAVLDLFMLRATPRFLGDPQPIQLTPEAEPA